MYIAFEGIDGAGKTTCMERLCGFLNWLRLPLDVVREPFDEYGIYKNLYELELTNMEQILLFIVSRSILMRRVKNALKRNMIVVSDRSMYSTISYQCVDEEQQTIVNKLHELIDVAVPDIVIYLRVPVEVAIKRRVVKNKYDNLSAEFLQRVSDRYDALASSDTRSKWLVFDATEDYPVVAERINAELVEYVRRKQ